MNLNDLQNKEYIGDGVYVGSDGYHIWLFTHDGYGIKDKVALEPEVIDNFIGWLISRMNHKIK